ncbi:sigma-70 family RNA polymerase sigma factor [Synechococcus sp. HK01-R]|jgi:RNA polymerase sigma factor (sigma-70 family)|uniref:sigma-70 family RNA polymerase sigma factor n=2 Tax=unclassified Synechococcus TaxID=2626047 RepID=UPI0016238AF8|nr:sigma-70 family RNA polymerase sigma factor [Synechococcus sp. HK01-R]QNG26824.1 sigma-70 family RNA polymerase sigma factor [Synechococcus sp. HK01-R]
MRDGAVTMILNSAGRQPIPTRAEQLHLARLIQQGEAADATPKQRKAGQRARQRLVIGNMRLAVAVARRLMPRLKSGASLEFADLIQEAIIGLNTAALRFDPERGCSFSTYAVWWCRQSVQRLIQVQASTIRIPAHVQDMERRWNFRPPTQNLEQFCQEWQTNPASMEMILMVVNQARTRSFDGPHHPQDAESGLNLSEQIGGTSDDPLEQIDRRLMLDRLQAAMPEELALLERHVVKRDSTKELAKERSISATAMGRQLQRARQRLRTVLERDTGHC